MSVKSSSFFQTLLCIGHSYKCFYRVNYSIHIYFTQVDIKYKDVIRSCLVEYMQICRTFTNSIASWYKVHHWLNHQREQLHKYCMSTTGILDMSYVLFFRFHCRTEALLQQGTCSVSKLSQLVFKHFCTCEYLVP